MTDAPPWQDKLLEDLAAMDVALDGGDIQRAKELNRNMTSRVRRHYGTPPPPPPDDPPPPPPTTYVLTTSRTGTGSGTITDNLGKIDCPGTCAGTYNENTLVVLTETPASGSVFSSWAGAASGTGSTTNVLMTSNKSVSAGFAVPTSPAATVPGTGAILFEDLCTGQDYVAAGWGNGAENPYTDYQNTAPASGDPYIVRRTNNADPHVPVGKVSPVTGSREFICLEGEQSIYDDRVNNQSTRCQFATWSSSAPVIFLPGDERAIYVSVYLPSPSPLPNNIGMGGGNQKYTQIFQFKGAIGGMNVGKDGVKFQIAAPNLIQDIIKPLTFGIWWRFCMTVKWSRGSDGYYQLWGDTNNSNTFKQLTPKRFGPTLDGSMGNKGYFGIGPYHYLSLFDGSVSGQPAGDLHMWFANIQICAFS